MSFYIQPIYSTSAGNAQDLYFNGQLKQMKMDDSYNNLWISGSYWIQSNSLLPAYAYYLDIDSEFGQVLNIPLHFRKQVEKKYKPNNADVLYTMDEYTFSFNFNLNQSSHFSDYIKSRIINFHIAPMFNQGVINDFNVQTNTNDVQKFVGDINKSRETYETQYANTYELAPGEHLLALNRLNTPDTINLNANVNKFDSRKIFNEFVEFKNLESKFNLLGAKIILTPLNTTAKPLEIELADTLYTGNAVSLGLDKYISYDENKQTLKEDFVPNINGIFIDKQITIQMRITIKFEYMKCIRTLILQQNLNFNSYEISDELSMLSYGQGKNVQLNNGYKELASEKII